MKILLCVLWLILWIAVGLVSSQCFNIKEPNYYMFVGAVLGILNQAILNI